MQHEFLSILKPLPPFQSHTPNRIWRQCSFNQLFINDPTWTWLPHNTHMGRNIFQNGLVFASDISGELGLIWAPWTNHEQLHRRDWRTQTDPSPSAHVSAKIRINTEIIPGFAHACFKQNRAHAEMVEKQQKSKFYHRFKRLSRVFSKDFSSYIKFLA